MKLSARSRYGVRIMLELALHYGEGFIPVKKIAKNQEISRRYVEHLIVSLQAVGLVKTIRGKNGGCILAKPPSQIKIGKVVETLEGSLAPVYCVENRKLCSREKICVARDIWIKVKEAILNVLNSITLEDMVKWHKEKLKGNEINIYYI
ncbi:MAG: RrF2 family transcriptional regulator [Candidatus Omnitrophica bacterium]|nr:RrF2 family transcriptional regulator [Candidatus Omnitrophota bacterium]